MVGELLNFVIEIITHLPNHLGSQLAGGVGEQNTPCHPGQNQQEHDDRPVIESADIVRQDGFVYHPSQDGRQAQVN